MPPNERLLRTQRLDVVASTLEHVAAELESPTALGPLLGISVPPGWPPGDYDRHALEFFRSRLEAGGSGVVGWYGWYAITRDAQGVRESLVAAAGYLGPPAGGTVEIGYSVLPTARRQGYAKEIVAALVAHALGDPSVRQVVAHTPGDNVGSIRVLLACGFERVGPGTEPGSVQYRIRKDP